MTLRRSGRIDDKRHPLPFEMKDGLVAENLVVMAAVKRIGPCHPLGINTHLGDELWTRRG